MTSAPQPHQPPGRSAIALLARCSALWLALACLVAAVHWVKWFDGPKIARLTWSHETTDGVVERIGPHGAATVRYTAGGAGQTQTHQSLGAEAGSTVRVYYNPQRPHESLIEEPAEALRDSYNGSGAVGVYGGAALAALAIIWRYSPRSTRCRRPSQAARQGSPR
jgi:hypothetical protein